MCYALQFVFTYILMPISFISFYILGINVLIDDYRTWKLCEAFNLLWIYIISNFTLIVINKIIVAYSLYNKKWKLFYLFLTLELILIIWGIIELYNTKLCDNLVISNLWSFGFGCLILNIIFYGVLSLVSLFNYNHDNKIDIIV